MSIFASKTPRDLNPHGVIMTSAGTLPLCSCGWQRRRLDGPTLADHIAEFDHVQHNEPNLILVDVRRYVEERSRMNQPKGWSRVLGIFSAAADYGHFVTGDWEEITSPEMLDHARRVLTRLANLAQIGA